MRDLQERRRIRNILHSPVSALILFVIVILLLRSNYNVYKTNQIAKINREESDRKLASLKEQSDRLSSELQRLNTERGVEDELRNKFQVTKGGEEVIVVVDDIPPANVKNANPEDVSGGYWRKLRELLGF